MTARRRKNRIEALVDRHIELFKRVIDADLPMRERMEALDEIRRSLVDADRGE